MTTTTPEKHLRPRKIPRQRRAVDTRARILDAARHVLATHGYAGGTTNRIADEAGLSVGSLYQYFPNKDAILVELVTAHIDEGTTAVLAALDDLTFAQAGAGVDVTVLVERVTRALVDVHARDRRLHRVLFEESPRPPSLLRQLRTLEDAAVTQVATVLRAERPALVDPDLAARITVATIESLVHRLVANDRPLDTEAFIAEVTRLVSGYLEPAG